MCDASGAWKFNKKIWVELDHGQHAYILYSDAPLESQIVFDQALKRGAELRTQLAGTRELPLEDSGEQACVVLFSSCNERSYVKVVSFPAEATEEFAAWWAQEHRANCNRVGIGACEATYKILSEAPEGFRVGGGVQLVRKEAIT